VTTEHFTTLRGARSSTIAEATDRATMFPGAVSGALVALGLIATAAGVSTAFHAFALILLPTLALVGLVTFNRVLQ
jgi:ABC-type Fe3+ transport system permease subunit